MPWVWLVSRLAVTGVGLTGVDVAEYVVQHQFACVMAALVGVFACCGVVAAWRVVLAICCCVRCWVPPGAVEGSFFMFIAALVVPVFVLLFDSAIIG